MISFSTLIAVAIASFLLVIVPGPSVTVIIANSLRSGTRAGLMTVAGTQLGVFLVILIVAAGLETVVSFIGEAFFWIKLLGAAYLIWLGIRMLRSNGDLGKTENVEEPGIGYFWQGFLVFCSNPKALFFFGAFLPQFVDLSRDTFSQTVILGCVFLLLATVCDSIYAIVAGKAGEWLTRSKVRFLEVVSGICLIGGGIWIALSKRI